MKGIVLKLWTGSYRNRWSFIVLGGVLITAVVGAPIIVLGAARGLRLRHPGSSSVANIVENSLVLPLMRFETRFKKNLLFFVRVVSIVTRLLLDDPRFEFREGKQIFLFSKSSRPNRWSTYSSFQWESELFLGDEAAGAWCWPLLYRPEAKNEWNYTSASPVCRHGVDRENFTCTVRRFSHLEH